MRRLNLRDNKMANKCVTVNIHLRDSSKKEISQGISGGSGDQSYLKALSDVLKTVQTETNTFLTEIIEKERGTTPISQADNGQKGLDEDGDEDDEEEEEDNSDLEEPPLKQPKT